MTRLKVVTGLTLSIAAFAQADDTRAFSNAAKARAVNYVRPGWFLVDGFWARPQATYAITDLVALNTDNDRDRLITLNNLHLEPLLRDWRTSLIQIKGNLFGWKLSCPARVWNDTRSGGTQNLLLIAGVDPAGISDVPVLSRIEITPARQVIQGVRRDGGATAFTSITLGGNFVEASIGQLNAAPPTVIRSTSLRQLMIDRPIEMRRDVIPVLKLINHGENPLAPAAGDVYRVFSDLPVDPQMTAAIEALVPKLNAREPDDRTRASEALHVLGRRGVQAALRMDLSDLPPESADRISAFIQDNTRDKRSADVLRHDASFLFDCADDTDPDVRTAATRANGMH